MSTTQIPSANPASATPGMPRPEGGDLYDARYWESAYREMHEAPALLIQLQDDLSRSRRREAFWISFVVHLVVVLLIVNSQKLAGLMPRRTMVLVNPNVLPQEKELTYLELPPDQQKFYPVMMALGFDPVWFAIILTINIEVGLITAPVGMNLYVLKGIDPEGKFEDIAVGSLPFVIIMTVMLVVLTIFPWLVTWLPNMMGM